MNTKEELNKAFDDLKKELLYRRQFLIDKYKQMEKLFALTLPKLKNLKWNMFAAECKNYEV